MCDFKFHLRNKLFQVIICIDMIKKFITWVNDRTV